MPSASDKSILDMISQYDLERCLSLNAHANDMPSQGIGVDCRKTLEIGFFFDGMGRHLEQDLREKRISNIGRLFSAFPGESQDRPGYASRAVYFSGLGTPYDASLSESIRGALHRAPSEAQATAEGHTRDSAFEAAGDTLSGKKDGHWWEVFGRSWKTSWTRPWDWVKSARDGLIRTGVEAIAPIRDHPIAANLLMSGAPTRQASAIEQFRGAVRDVTQSSQMPLGYIRVSVFGFDFGAAMAKAFIRELLEDVCERQGDTYHYQGAEVQIVFAGLLDCVDRTHPEMGPLDWFHPLTPVLDDGGPLHPACRRALHLIAAHERRFYRRCRPIGPLQADWHEILQPGISEDIGGGLKADEQKPSAELSRATLHRMYRHATTAGVPFPSLEELQEKDVLTAALFELNDRVDGYSFVALSRYYERYTQAYLSPTSASFEAHMLVYLGWLARRFRDYRQACQMLDAKSEALPNRYYHQTLGAVAASVTDTEEKWQDQEAQRADIDSARQALTEQWGWLERVDEEASDILNRFSTGHNAIAAHTKAALRDEWSLAKAWQRWTKLEEPPELPEPLALLFANGLHDRQRDQLDYRTDQPSALAGGYHFMAWRGIDMPE